MKHSKRISHTIQKKSSFYIRLLSSILILSFVFRASGCATNKNGKKVSLPDFSVYEDGGRITDDEVKAYQDYVLSTLIISEKDGSISGTHTGLFSTVVVVTLYHCTDRALLRSAFSLLARYETILSRTMPGSELYCANHSNNEEIEISEELASLISFGLDYHETSHGAFDITVAPLSDLWSFTAEEPSVPTAADIDRCRSFVDSTAVSIEHSALKKPVGVTIDLGAIAKGWLADRLALHLKENNITSALINLGGNALAVGEKAEHVPYRIGITMPFSNGDVAGVVNVADLSVVTSGIYERCFVKDNHLYHHILDARTGYPADNDLLSVTIVCENSAMADALSTVCFLLGKTDGATLISELSKTEPVYVLFLTGTYDPETMEISELAYHFTDGFEEACGFTY